MILGASVYQVPLIKVAKSMGLYTIVASIPGEYPGFAFADKVYEINTVDKEAILEAARAEKIDGICTSGTDVAVATIGYVCEKMGLAGLPEEAAGKATDKALMKEAFRAAGVAASEFRRVYTLEEAYQAAKEIGYPVVVKRVDSSGSRGITIVREDAKLEEAYHNAIDFSRKDYVLVESMLQGTEIGVDGMVQHGELVFLAPHAKFVYHSGTITMPVGHGFPYHGSEALMKEIEVQMRRAVTALGLDNCSVNADVFVNGDSAWIIEMGGRTGATCIPELISMHYGFDFYKKILLNALGETVDFKAEKEGVSCMAKLLMSPVDGVITSISEDGLAQIRSEGIEVALDYAAGHSVERMINGTTRIGHVVAPVDCEEMLDQIIKRVYRCITVDNVSLEELWER